MSTPNKERLRLWVADLRTTDRPQGKLYLRTEAGDCCLARACEVYRTATGLGQWEGRSFIDGEGGWSETEMPPGVREWFGISNGNPDLTSAGGYRRSAQWYNDTQGATFPTIAAAIERTFALAS